MKKLIKYEIMTSIITLGVFFAIFFSVGRHDGNASFAAGFAVVATAVAVLGGAVAAFGGTFAAVPVPATDTAGVVAAVVAIAAIFTAGVVAGLNVIPAPAPAVVVVAVGFALVVVVLFIANIVASAFGHGRDYAKKNGLAGKQVFASLAFEYMAIVVPMLLCS